MAETKLPTRAAVTGTYIISYTVSNLIKKQASLFPDSKSDRKYKIATMHEKQINRILKITLFTSYMQ